MKFDRTICVHYTYPLCPSQVRSGDIRRSSAPPRPPCDGTIAQQTPCSPCPYPSDRTPLDATMKRVDTPAAWSSHSEPDETQPDGRDAPQEVAPHAHRGVVGAPNYAYGIPPWTYYDTLSRWVHIGTTTVTSTSTTPTTNNSSYEPMYDLPFEYIRKNVRPFVRR